MEVLWAWECVISCPNEKTELILLELPEFCPADCSAHDVFQYVHRPCATDSELLILNPGDLCDKKVFPHPCLPSTLRWVGRSVWGLHTLSEPWLKVRLWKRLTGCWLIMHCMNTAMHPFFFLLLLLQHYYTTNQSWNLTFYTTCSNFRS